MREARKRTCACDPPPEMYRRCWRVLMMRCPASAPCSMRCPVPGPTVGQTADLPLGNEPSPATTRAILPAVCNSNVDLPIPGSPAISVTEPGTTPPPSTRSNSENPVPKPLDAFRAHFGNRTGLDLALLATVTDCVRDVRPGAAVREPAAGRASWVLDRAPLTTLGATAVPLRPVPTALEHTYCTLDFAMVSP